MLNRRQLGIGFVASAVLGGRVNAQDYASDVEARLTQEGFRIDSVERTLLGRVRILATKGSDLREVIINPRTGEVLRDLWVSQHQSESAQPQQDDAGTGNGGGQAGSEGEHDQDEEGSGKGRSGESGNGNSGQSNNGNHGNGGGRGTKA